MGPELKWVLPEDLDIPPDKLLFRVDIYQETILLHQFSDGATTTKMVSAQDIARAFTRELRLHSSILPPNALWWTSGAEGGEVALWQQPKRWKVALQMEAFKPPRRFELPMPGLVFICSPGRPPRVYAAKSRPTSLNSSLFHAPLFNIFQDGRSCAGTHRYPDDVGEIPRSFFTSFFTKEGYPHGRSKKYPEDLLALWEELDGKKSYPVRDLKPCVTVEELLGDKERR